MKTIAYLCSYNTEEEVALQELSFQKSKIIDYAFKNDLKISELFTETNAAKEQSKPVLLHLMNKFYGKIDKIIVYNPDVISLDTHFRNWIAEELLRIGIEICYIEDAVEKKNIKEKATILKSKVKNLPSLPLVMNKAMEILKDQRASIFDFSNIISNDIGLSVRVLKMVNSQYYGSTKQITKIREAIILLGLTTIRGIILSASISKILAFNKKGQFNYDQFWKHSILTALGARHIYKKIQLDEVDNIFSIAFLHDIGKLILAQHDYKNYQKVLMQEIELTERLKNIQFEEKECGINHCELAYEISKHWELPQPFLDVMKFHHTPILSKNYKKTCFIVNLVDYLVNLILCDKILDINLINQDIFDNLKITKQDVVQLYDYLRFEKDNVKDVNRFFNQLDGVLRENAK